MPRPIRLRNNVLLTTIRRRRRQQSGRIYHAAPLPPSPRLYASLTLTLVVVSATRAVSLSSSKHSLLSHPDPRSLRPFSTTRATMSSDETYLSFLEQANRDPTAPSNVTGEDAGAAPGTAHSGGGSGNDGGGSGFRATKTRDESSRVPRVLDDVLASGDEVYVSEADEPWESVVLKWDVEGKGWPDEETFKSLILPHASDDASTISVSTESPSSFDPRNRYERVLHTVRLATLESVNGERKSSDVEVRIYRVSYGSTRAEYWVLALDETAGRIVGAKARAVES